MRLWHQSLIPKLPRQQLLGQHRECAALRGLGWGKKHATVDYVFNHNPYLLFLYHWEVMREINNRGYKIYAKWFNPFYRGKQCEPYTDNAFDGWEKDVGENYKTDWIYYPEHNDTYYKECIDNLKGKGILIA